jgi:hypothetical protein
MFWTRLCVNILLSLFLSFAICWFSPLGFFFIIASWSWHGQLIIQVSVFPKGFNGVKVPSIFCVHSDFCIFLWCFYVLYKTLCDHPSQPIPFTIESLFIIGSLAWCARLIALSASFWLCEINVELFLGRFRYVLGVLVYFDQVFSLRFFRAACLWTWKLWMGKIFTDMWKKMERQPKGISLCMDKHCYISQWASSVTRNFFPCFLWCCGFVIMVHICFSFQSSCPWVFVLIEWCVMECAAIVVSCHALPCDDNSVCPLLGKEISWYL